MDFENIQFGAVAGRVEEAGDRRMRAAFVAGDELFDIGSRLDAKRQLEARRRALRGS